MSINKKKILELYDDGEGLSISALRDVLGNWWETSSPVIPGSQTGLGNMSATENYLHKVLDTPACLLTSFVVTAHFHRTTCSPRPESTVLLHQKRKQYVLSLTAGCFVPFMWYWGDTPSRRKVALSPLKKRIWCRILFLLKKQHVT